MNNRGKHRVLVIPDLQAPFEHRDAVAFLKWVNKKWSPDLIVNVGDECDMHALGDWEHDPDGYSAGTELEKAIEHLQGFYDLFPRAMVCTSNHTARPFRRAFKHGIPRAYLRDYKEFLRAPAGWNWADSWEVDGIKYYHGEGQSGPLGALKAAISFGKPTVIGHLHSDAGIQYWANEETVLYGFNVGCLIDRHQYAFKYQKHFPKKPILGCGIVDKGIPTFIPMLLDHKHRWIKS